MHGTSSSSLPSTTVAEAAPPPLVAALAPPLPWRLLEGAENFLRLLGLGCSKASAWLVSAIATACGASDWAVPVAVLQCHLSKCRWGCGCWHQLTGIPRQGLFFAWWLNHEMVEPRSYYDYCGHLCWQGVIGFLALPNYEIGAVRCVEKWRLAVVWHLSELFCCCGLHWLIIFFGPNNIHALKALFLHGFIISKYTITNYKLSWFFFTAIINVLR